MFKSQSLLTYLDILDMYNLSVVNNIKKQPMGCNAQLTD